MEVTSQEASSLALSLDQQTTRNALWTAVLNIDLQLYKGSVYKLRWGSPGVGLDLGIPCYQEARRTAEETEWPDELAAGAADLAERIARYIVTLEERDVTTASGQHSQLMGSFESLREQVRAWPGSAGAGVTGNAAGASANRASGNGASGSVG
jgi:hypothetical protein